MLLRLDDGRRVNTDYFITVGVGSVKDQPGHHIIATLINGQLMSLFLFDDKGAADAKLDLITKNHNLHHMNIDNMLTVRPNLPLEK